MPKIIPLEQQLKIFEEQCFSGEESKRILQLYNSCVEQTKKFVTDSGFSDVVIGVSGGIDSALCAKIAVDAFGKDHVHAMILPGPHSSSDTLNDAKKLCENLDIEFKMVFINSVCDSILNTFTDENNKISDLTSQNIQARVRMIMIMAQSNENNWLMLNTANKSEVYTGYSTLYGDMAGGFAPIGDVYKCDVYKMCIAKNLQERRMFENNEDVIPASVILRAPSAELSENQTDEKSLGIDYATLDAILHEAIDNDKSATDVVFLGYSEVDVQRVFTLIRRSEYKRHYEPPCAIL